MGDFIKRPLFVSRGGGKHHRQLQCHLGEFLPLNLRSLNKAIS